MLVEIVGLLLGVRIRSMWGTAMWSYAGVVLLFFLQLNMNRDTFRRTLYRSAVCASLIALAFGGRNSLLPHVRGKASRIHFPGRQLALEVGDLYHQQTGEYPTIVGGPWWVASNVAFYGRQPASVFADLDESISPWVTDRNLSEHGGVIVWTKSSDDSEFEDSITRRFPNAQLTESLELASQTSATLAPVRFGVAIVLPENHVTAMKVDRVKATTLDMASLQKPAMPSDSKRR